MKKSVLRSYAHLIAARGVNVQKGQEVIITCSFDQIEFIRILVEECYKCGASNVRLKWSDPKITISNFKHRKVNDMSKLTSYEEAEFDYDLNKLPARIYIDSDSPDALNKVNMKKYGEVVKARMPQIKKYRDQMDGKYQWCIAAVPSYEWAKMVFPNLSKKEAMNKMWEVILKTSRAYEGDPVQNWLEHNKNLKAKCEKLNSLNLKELHYKNSIGTDFKVGLIKDVIWLGGSEDTMDGKVNYDPNIPSEECFTTPMKGKAEGKVVAAMPLSYRGQLIKNFWFEFKDGKVINYDAKVGKDLIKQMLEVDENAAYLGECALIPFDSPINNTGLLFYNTLFDENASCHLALGRGFENLVKGYENMTREEIKAKGINDSGSHVDFMIGTKDLSIVGIDEEGKEHQIFLNGDWAI